MTKNLSIPERFWEKVEIQGSGCWEWRGAIGKRGYGNFSLGGGKFINSHRLSWRFAYGYLPKRNIFVCHRCDNRKCVNPNHLFLGTAKENTRDMISKGRLRKRGSMRGENGPNAKLTLEEVREIRALRGTHREIADRFGVSRSAISMIRSGLNWANCA